MIEIGGRTSIYAVIGDPIEHTLSPYMQNRALETMGLDAVYVAFRVPSGELEQAVRGMNALGIGGLNVTVPHKTAVIPFLDDLTDTARAVGAVNTIISRDGRLIGDNTDSYGFAMCVLSGAGIDTFPDHVCVLGAGGAAHGVVHACVARPEVREVVIVNRTRSKAESLAAEFDGMSDTVVSALATVDASFSAVVSGAGLVVNTTSLGMHPNIDTTPIEDPSVFGEGRIVCDIVYNPRETRLLGEARERGAITVNGLAMLAYQGARSLELWTGMTPPVDVMLDVLENRAGR